MAQGLGEQVTLSGAMGPKMGSFGMSAFKTQTRRALSAPIRLEPQRPGPLSDPVIPRDRAGAGGLRCQGQSRGAAEMREGTGAERPL